MVILDDYVVNIAGFIDEHPGGKFSLEHNIGRDVSKFFYGGYSLEPSTNETDLENIHSSDARKIVNRLIIGKLEGNVQRRLMKIKSS